MPDSVDITEGQLREVAEQLDGLCLQLSDGQRAVLTGVLAAGGRELGRNAGEEEVQGFAALLVPAVQSVRSIPSENQASAGATFLAAVGISAEFTRPNGKRGWYRTQHTKPG